MRASLRRLPRVSRSLPQAQQRPWRPQSSHTSSIALQSSPPDVPIMTPRGPLLQHAPQFSLLPRSPHDHNHAYRQPKPLHRLPYHVDAVFSGTRHKPPAKRPELPRHTIIVADGDLQEYFRSHTHTPLTITLNHSPKLGHDEGGSIHVRVKEPIRVADKHAAQLAEVEVQHASPPLKPELGSVKLLAKFYDPLYWDWRKAFPADPFESTDSAEAHEVACYRALETQWGKCVPHFYGAFTVNVPVHEVLGFAHPPRKVLMVLLEYVQGTDLSKLDWHRVPVHAKKAIAVALIERDADINLCDVAHDDFAPRNVVLVNDRYEDMASPTWSPDLRYIDFERGSVGSISKTGLMARLKRDRKKELRDQWQRARLFRRFEGLLEGWVRTEKPAVLRLAEMQTEMMRREKEKKRKMAEQDRYAEWMDGVFGKLAAEDRMSKKEEEQEYDDDEVEEDDDDSLE